MDDVNHVVILNKSISDCLMEDGRYYCQACNFYTTSKSSFTNHLYTMRHHRNLQKLSMGMSSSLSPVKEVRSSNSIVSDESNKVVGDIEVVGDIGEVCWSVHGSSVNVKLPSQSSLDSWSWHTDPSEGKDESKKLEEEVEEVEEVEEEEGEVIGKIANCDLCCEDTSFETYYRFTRGRQELFSCVKCWKNRETQLVAHASWAWEKCTYPGPAFYTVNKEEEEEEEEELGYASDDSDDSDESEEPESGYLGVLGPTVPRKVFGGVREVVDRDNGVEGYYVTAWDLIVGGVGCFLVGALYSAYVVDCDYY